MAIKENFKMRTKATIFKFKDPNDEIANAIRAGMKPEDAIKKFGAERFIGKEVHEGNVALDDGIAELIKLLTATGSPTAYSNAAAYIGVGESATAAAHTQTGLLGSTKTYKAMDTSYPTTVLTYPCSATWQSTFGSADANIAWNEYIVCHSVTGAAPVLNRIVTSKGTKASGETWTLQIQITPS